MRVVTGSNGDSVRIGVLASFPSYSDPRGFYYSASDPVTTVLDRCAILVGDFPVRFLSRDYSPTSESYDQNVLMDRPDSPDGYVDRYGNVLNSFGRLTAALSGQYHFGRCPSNEHEVYHASSRGTVTPQLPGSYRHNDGATTTLALPLFPSWRFPILRASDYANCTSLYKDSLTHYEPSIPYGTAYPQPMIVDYVRYVAQQVDAVGGFGGVVSYYGWYSYSLITNFVYSLGDDGSLEVKYDAKWHFSEYLSDVILSPKWSWTYSGRLTVTPKPRGFPTALPMSVGESRLIYSPTTYDCCYECETTALYQRSTPYPNYTPHVGQVDVFNQNSSLAVALDHPFTYSASSINAIKNRIVTRSRYEGFKQACIDDLPELRGTAFLSTANAIENLGEKFGANLLETLTELGGLLEFLPDLKSLLDSYRLLKSGDFGKSAVKFVRTLSQEYLRAQFGTMPNIDLALQQLPRLASVIESFATLSATDKVSIYGSWSYQLPPEQFGFTAKLTTRSKVVLRDYPSEPLRSILGLQRLGLFPSISNVWETVPMSFVVDWLTSLGPTFRTIENLTAIALMTPEYYVHSYTFEAPISAEDLDAMGLDKVNEPTYRFYAREISYTLPTPTGSKYAFLFPQRLPFWLTPIALLISRS